MKITYGIDVKESEDPYISIAEEALTGLAEAAVIGVFWVDTFPLLRFIPNWIPGAGFLKKAARWKAAFMTMTEKPFEYVKEQLVKDHFPDSQYLASLFNEWFCRKVAQRCHPWQQTSSRIFLLKMILNGLWKRGLRKGWLLRPTQVRDYVLEF